jgi:hypothetical protein
MSEDIPYWGVQINRAQWISGQPGSISLACRGERRFETVQGTGIRRGPDRRQACRNHQPLPGRGGHAGTDPQRGALHHKPGGYASLSMRKLARRLGVTAKTIYNYYANMDEITSWRSSTHS